MRQIILLAAALAVASPVLAEENLVEPLSNGLRLSMTQNEIQNTFGSPTDPSWDSRTFGYKEFSVQTGGSRLEIWRVRLKAGVRMSSGIGPGSTRADVRRVFGAEERVTHGQYELTFEYAGDRVDQIKIEPAHGSFVEVRAGSPDPHRAGPGSPDPHRAGPGSPDPHRAGPKRSGLQGSALVGKWHGNGSPLELRADGTYLFGGKPAGRWRVEGDEVVFDGPLTSWNGGRARMKEGRIEFLWKDARGAYWFWYAR